MCGRTCVEEQGRYLTHTVIKEQRLILHHDISHYWDVLRAHSWQLSARKADISHFLGLALRCFAQIYIYYNWADLWRLAAMVKHGWCFHTCIWMFHTEMFHELINVGLLTAMMEERCGKPEVVVMPGFVASTSRGETCLLGRGGSDTSASLIAGI